MKKSSTKKNDTDISITNDVNNGNVIKKSKYRFGKKVFSLIIGAIVLGSIVHTILFYVKINDIKYKNKVRWEILEQHAHVHENDETDLSNDKKKDEENTGSDNLKEEISIPKSTIKKRINPYKKVNKTSEKVVDDVVILGKYESDPLAECENIVEKWEQRNRIKDAVNHFIKNTSFMLGGFLVGCASVEEAPVEIEEKTIVKKEEEVLDVEEEPNYIGTKPIKIPQNVLDCYDLLAQK